MEPLLHGEKKLFLYRSMQVFAHRIAQTLSFRCYKTWTVKELISLCLTFALCETKAWPLKIIAKVGSLFLIFSVFWLPKQFLKNKNWLNQKFLVPQASRCKHQAGHQYQFADQARERSQPAGQTGQSALPPYGWKMRYSQWTQSR